MTPTITSAMRQELRSELKAAGLFERTPHKAWIKLVFLLVCAGVVGYLAMTQPAPAFWLLQPVAALFVTAAAMLGHEGAHKSMATSSKHNSWMLHLTFPLLGGLGTHHWKNKHNVRHHVHPNTPGQDLDIEMWPMASYASAYQAAGPARQAFIRSGQKYVFWPLSALLPFAMRVNSWLILRRIAKERGRDTAWWLDVAALTLHYLLWLVIPGTLWGWPQALQCYVSMWLLVGLYLSLIFAPAHMGMPIQAAQGDEWLAQLQTTRNLKMGPLLSFFFVGLDYQVEHHLFPGISHFHLPEAARRTKAWAQRHGLPYHEIGYWAGVADVTDYLGRAWQEPTRMATAA